MDEKEKKIRQLAEIKNLLAEFSTQYLTEELAGYVFTLLEKLGRKRAYSITRGKKEVWASAIVYVIARLNFLFDTKNPSYLTADVICDFFGTKKSTVSTKATDIEKACNIRMGEEGLCSSDISDSLSFVQLTNGMIITKKQAKEMRLM